jgi:hypothetical protein
MRKVEIEIIMCRENFIQYQLQHIAETLIFAEIFNGITVMLVSRSREDFIFYTICSFLTIIVIRCFFYPRSKTKTKVKIDVDEDCTVIPKGAIITNSFDECLFETVSEYKFESE